jgi:hypothetical protein
MQWTRRKEDVMFDRVVAVLVAVVLLLFSASAALACSGCHRDSAQCLATLDAQAEEVISTDLEVLSSLDLEHYLEAEPRDDSAQYNEWAMTSEDGTDRHVIAQCAAGVSDTDASTRDGIEAPDTRGRHGVGV